MIRKTRNCRNFTNVKGDDVLIRKLTLNRVDFRRFDFHLFQHWIGVLLVVAACLIIHI